MARKGCLSCIQCRAELFLRCIQVLLQGLSRLDIVLQKFFRQYNEWNESISAAIQDYEDHVVPILERDETFEMNCPVYDMNDIVERSQ